MIWTLRVVSALIAIAVIGVAGLFVVARFSDGPLAIVAGGPFSTGETVREEISDWSFVHDLREVEFQLLDPARSRTTWIVEHDGRAYIPSGYMTSWWGRLWKHWPYEAERDGRILLRIDGRIYPSRLRRVESGPRLAPVLAELSRKYAGGAAIPVEAVESGSLWIFEVAPRSWVAADLDPED